MKRFAISLFMATALLISMASPTSAWSQPADGVIGSGGYTWFTNDRLVNIHPWEIAAQRTGGTTGFLQLMWYGCNGGSGAGPWTSVGYYNWSWLRSGTYGPVRFCLAAHGTPGSTFNIILDWDYDPWPIEPYRNEDD